MLISIIVILFIVFTIIVISNIVDYFNKKNDVKSPIITKNKTNKILKQGYNSNYREICQYPLYDESRHSWYNNSECSGFSGISGYSGLSGFSGIRGYSRLSGFGYSGYSGYSGDIGEKIIRSAGLIKIPSPDSGFITISWGNKETYIINNISDDFQQCETTASPTLL